MMSDLAMCILGLDENALTYKSHENQNTYERIKKVQIISNLDSFCDFSRFSLLA